MLFQLLCTFHCLSPGWLRAHRMAPSLAGNPSATFSEVRQSCRDLPCILTQKARCGHAIAQSRQEEILCCQQELLKGSHGGTGWALGWAHRTLASTGPGMMSRALRQRQQACRKQTGHLKRQQQAPLQTLRIGKAVHPPLQQLPGFCPLHCTLGCLSRCDDTRHPLYSRAVRGTASWLVQEALDGPSADEAITNAM